MSGRVGLRLRCVMDTLHYSKKIVAIEDTLDIIARTSSPCKEDLLIAITRVNRCCVVLKVNVILAVCV